MENDVKDLLAAIRQMQGRFGAYYTQALSKHHLSIQHFTLLFNLFSEGPMIMNTMAAKLAVTSPAITHLVDRLETEDLLKRTLCEDDRRAYMLSITDNGRRLIESVVGTIYTLLETTIQGFNTAERESIKRFYQTMTENFDRDIRL